MKQFNKNQASSQGILVSGNEIKQGSLNMKKMIVQKMKQINGGIQKGQTAPVQVSRQNNPQSVLS